MMETKKWYESKIVWLAFLGFVIVLLGHFGIFVPEGTAEQLVNQDWAGNIFMAILNAAIIIARIFFTNKKVTV